MDESTKYINARRCQFCKHWTKTEQPRPDDPLRRVLRCAKTGCVIPSYSEEYGYEALSVPRGCRLEYDTTWANMMALTMKDLPEHFADFGEYAAFQMTCTQKKPGEKK